MVWLQSNVRYNLTSTKHRESGNLCRYNFNNTVGDMHDMCQFVFFSAELMNCVVWNCSSDVRTHGSLRLKHPETQVIPMLGSYKSSCSGFWLTWDNWLMSTSIGSMPSDFQNSKKDRSSWGTIHTADPDNVSFDRPYRILLTIFFTSGHPSEHVPHQIFWLLRLQEALGADRSFAIIFGFPLAQDVLFILWWSSHVLSQFRMGQDLIVTITFL